MSVISSGRRYLCLLILLAFLVFLTGCVKGRLHATVHRNGSIDLDYILTLPKNVDQKFSDPLKRLRAEAVEEGFDVKLVDTGDRRGFHATRKLRGPAIMPDFRRSLTRVGRKSPLWIKRGFLWEHYSFQTELPVTKLGLLDDLGLKEAFFARMNLKFSLTLPGKIVRTNADEIEDDGHTMVWVLDPQGENTMTAETRVFSWSHLALLLSVGLIMTGVIYGINLHKQRTEAL